MFSIYRMNTSTKLLRLGTQQYSPYIYCRTVFSPQIIKLNFISQLKICTARKIASKKQNLEDKCILQESCKTVGRWQRYILLVKGEQSTYSL